MNDNLSLLDIGIFFNTYNLKYKSEGLQSVLSPKSFPDTFNKYFTICGLVKMV